MGRKEIAELGFELMTWNYEVIFCDNAIGIIF